MLYCQHGTGKGVRSAHQTASVAVVANTACRLHNMTSRAQKHESIAHVVCRRKQHMAAALAALAGHQSRQVRQQTAQQLPQLVQTMPPSLAAATLIASAHPSLSLSVCMPVFTSPPCISFACFEGAVMAVACPHGHCAIIVFHSCIHD